MLPAEIIDHIFSFLQNDRSALSACSTAHPLLSSLTEQYLFIDLLVYIDTRYPSATNGISVSKLSRCLSERPNLASHVRSLTIDGRLYTGSSYKAFQELSTILPSIQHSESLSLRNIQWLRLPDSFPSSLLDFLRTPHMREIYLRSCANFPLSILDDSKNIKSLKLDSSDFNFMDTPNTTPTSLEALFLGEVTNEPDFMSWAEPRVNSLTSLYAKPTLFPFPVLTPIFYASFGSLTSLTFAIGTAFRTVYSNTGQYLPTISSPQSNFQFDLTVLDRLELVTIHASIEACIYPIRETGEALRYGHSCKTCFPTISRLILTAGPSLERLVLNLNCTTIDEAANLCYAVEWEPLILLSDSLAHLRVDLCVLALDSQGQLLPVDEVVDSLSANEDLSRLMDRGSLVVEPPFTPPDF